MLLITTLYQVNGNGICKYEDTDFKKHNLMLKNHNLIPNYKDMHYTGIIRFKTETLMSNKLFITNQ